MSILFNNKNGGSRLQCFFNFYVAAKWATWFCGFT